MAGMLFNGTTSKLEDTAFAALNFDQMTFCGHVCPTAVGEFRTFIRADEFDNAWSVTATASGTARFRYFGTISNGVWTFPIGVDGVQSPIAVSFDRTSLLNDPVARYNYAAATITETSAPGGLYVTPLAGYCVGNISTQTFTLAGGLMHFFVHNVILTAAEMDSQLRYPGSIRRGGILWLPMLNGTYTRALAVSGDAWVTAASSPTATDLATFTTSSPKCRPLDADLPMAA